jgi:hypothetical protein
LLISHLNRKVLLKTDNNAFCVQNYQANVRNFHEKSLTLMRELKKIMLRSASATIKTAETAHLARKLLLSFLSI